MRIAALLLCSVSLAACGEGASDKAGGKNPTKATVLTFANGNGISENLRPFAAEVERLSGGTLRVEFKSDWRANEPAFEVGLIRDVQAGKADLGWAGSRAFADVGVSSFDALHAPLLIDSYPLQRKVLESPLVANMLARLRLRGVVGVGILPGPLRKPLGTKALVRRADYAGKRVAFQRSRVAEHTLRALGARPASIAAGAPIDRYDAVEQQVSSTAMSDYDRHAAHLTVNVNLWPRPAVVFVNAATFKRLDGRQRKALRDAARRALAPTLAYEQSLDNEGAANLCRRGVAFLHATGADLADLRRAVQPVYAALERDAQTKRAIAEIRALRTAVGEPADAPTCSGAAPTAAGAGSPTLIDGVYRSDVTMKDLQRTPGYDSGENHPGNVGHFRMELRAGRFRVTGSSDGVDQEGTYSVKGDVLTFNWNGEGEFSYRWNLYRGALTLTKLEEGPTTFVVHPWRRLGEKTSVGARTPIDGVYTMTSNRQEVAQAFGEPAKETPSENYGKWRFVLDRGLMRYTQSSEGAHRWETATYTVKGGVFTFTITDYGGETPTGAPERVGETFTYSWSLNRDRLTLKPVKGKISPPLFSIKAWRRVGDAR